MLRQTLVVLLAVGLAGCAGARKRPAAAKALADTTPTADAPAEAMTDTQLAAHAGNAEFPTARPRTDVRVAAIVTKDRRMIKLYNFENAPISAVNVWVNRAYVQPLRGIPPHSKAQIRGDKLFNKLGQRFSERGEEVNRVQLETQDAVYEVLGPATE